ncbi:MAG: hypothetical protein V4543_02030 [Bacteroidota bacterium]
MRWLLLLSLLFSIYRAFSGWFGNKPFSKTDNASRHWTATFSHIQLSIGYLLWFQSPMVSFFRTHYEAAMKNPELEFFGEIHITLMTIAVIVLTIGSALAKRKETDKAKFRIMAIMFSLALLIIFIAIPWPFSPFAHRPYFR